MGKEVVLSIRGSQAYADQEPEVIELVTNAVLEKNGEGWDLQYEETDLTGMEGVTTTFRVQPGEIILDRTGKLTSQMVFREGVSHDSLYQLAFGTMMLTVCATKVCWELSEDGGVIDLVYGIEIEQNAAGVITYHLEAKAKE